MVDRVRNISSWRQELGAELDRNKNETNHMMRTRYFRGSDIQHLSRYYILLLRKQLEHALKETEKPLSVTSTCIYNREGRMGIDRVKDDVETRLYSESDTIRNTQNRLKDALNSVHKHMMNMLIVSTLNFPSLHTPGEPADQL